ncbi:MULTISPECIES: DUF5763 domain-containing protein [Tenacibaculum]|uniref:DUF5763 domain-containing protein n=1 Tax=Tenacibaculum TaxID=104267 RepID=UPI001F0A9804|nr:MULTISPECIES: DUF5763 domain-containing protein [Tenacibaculum]MCH3883266.1 DUF5763 domain-containing protein [Tenacibaculum aquimarinum]MDO6600378.1 DUF5763 domain-containing protein [Tenacibaculum sp. 1_MG-2023]
MKYITIIFFIFLSFNSKSQNVYKTPSGKKYHLASCRMVENVSKKLLGISDVSKFHLSPCKICKPPILKGLVKSFNSKNKAVGKSKSVRCKGVTKKGTRCKHVTKIANGYCYQHTNQDSKQKIQKTSFSSNKATLCGARTKSGKSCRRKVKGTGYCYQHR